MADWDAQSFDVAALLGVSPRLPSRIRTRTRCGTPFQFRWRTSGFVIHRPDTPWAATGWCHGSSRDGNVEPADLAQRQAQADCQGRVFGLTCRASITLQDMPSGFPGTWSRCSSRKFDHHPRPHPLSGDPRR